MSIFLMVTLVGLIMIFKLMNDLKNLTGISLVNTPPLNNLIISLNVKLFLGTPAKVEI